MIQPAAAATGRPGLSFFIVASRERAVEQAAHAFRGAAPWGCQCFPLDKLPSSLMLMVDKVQLTDALGAPVLLHASLAPVAAMSPQDFMAALRQWQGILPCAMEGAGGALGCPCEPGCEEACAGSSCAATLATLAGAAAKLAALLHKAAAAQPMGGSPGMQQ